MSDEEIYERLQTKLSRCSNRNLEESKEENNADN